jgi:hypothetical protein
MGLYDYFFGNGDPYAAQAARQQAERQRATEDEYLRRRSQMRLPYAMPPMRDNSVGPAIDAQMAQDRTGMPQPPAAADIMSQIMRSNGQYGQEQRFRPTTPPEFQNTEPGFSGVTGGILADALRPQGRPGAAPAAPAAPQAAAPRPPMGNVPLPVPRPADIGQLPGATPNGFQMNEQQQAQMRAYADQFAGGDMSKVNTRLIRNDDGSYMPDFYTKGLLSGLFGGGQ